MSRPDLVIMLGLALSGVSESTSAQTPPARAVDAEASAEAEVRRVDMAQADAAQSDEPDTMAAFLHPNYLVHLPNGRIVDRAEMLERAAGGSLAKERFERRQERVAMTGDVAVVVGIDRMVAPPPLALRGELSRRYTNVYVRETQGWRLIARHFHFIP